MSEEKVNLNKTVFDKVKFRETVDTTFSQLVTKPEQIFFDTNLATINDFFTIYENLFYEIPKEGAINSHTYLAKTSIEYVGFEEINENIQALLDEISSLREDLLEANQTIIDLQTGTTNFQT